MGVSVDFGATTVDRTTACNKCHWISPHPKHFAAAQCGGCHVSWYTPTRTVFYVPSISSPFGWFSTSTSPYTAASDLHAIHTKRTWLADVNDYSQKCGSCHAAAACDSCHEQPVTHGEHGVAGDSLVGVPTAPAQVSVAPGLPVLDAGRTDLQKDTASSCAATQCHAGVNSHEVIDDFSPRVAYTGAWAEITDTSLAGGSIRYTTDTSASVTLTFSGTEIAWIGERSTSGGIVEIYIDGALYGEADTYLTVRGYSKTIRVVRDLPAGEHTLRLQATGRKNASSYGYKFSVQRFDARTAAAAFAPVPNCSNCHAQHGDLTAKHVSSWTMDGCTASGCHLTNEIATEHDHWQPVNTCELCHGAAVSETVANAVDAGKTNCDACHTASGAAHHELHYAASVNQRGCSSCHSMYLDTEHANRGLDCGVCHDADADALTKAAVVNGDLRCVACHGSQPHRRR